MPERASSLYDLLAARAQDDPSAPAILAPNRDALSFGALVEHIDAVGSWLNGRGLGRGDRLAVFAPRGPETAVAALATMCSAICVPVNPLATAAECEAIFARTRVRALLVPAAAMGSPAHNMARKLGLAVLEWSVAPGVPAGQLRLDGDGPAGASPVEPRGATPDDLGLVVHTSGTTAEPKRVPSSHGNLLARAAKSVHLFGLRRSDRCLNLMPLCYTHGLSSGLIPPLAVGGSVICPAGFDADGFFACLAELHPTWYTAGASYHQAIADWLRSRPGAASGHTLRFARSGSSPLARRLQHQLEHLLGVPLVESYGTTETGPVSSNPPEGLRKPGTVGVSPDGDVAVVDDHGAVLPSGVAGEVVVTGPTVIAGYEGDPDTNRVVFRDGSYRTGDLGVLDADGYLTLMGRVKETINRGGEKISPREVEAVLLDHPAVAEAVTFALPHPSLHEDVAAAVILHPERGATGRDLRQFLLQRLTPFKVPRRIVIADALPKGPTGKLLRHGLAEHFGLQAHVTNWSRAGDHRDDPMERTLLALFREVLRRDDVGPDDDFFVSGGDSLSAVDLIARIEEELDVSVPLLSLVETSTVRALARQVYQALDVNRDVIGVNLGGRQRPLFGICGRYGYAVRLLLVGREIGSEQPVYGLQPPGMDWQRAGCRTIPEMAAYYVGRIRAIQSRGPYRLLGTSFGGLVAFEMALQLQAAGDAVDFLGLLDTQPTTCRWNGRTEQHDASLLTVAEDEEANPVPRGATEEAGVRVARAHVWARAAYVLERPFRGELTYFYCAGATVTPRQDRRRLWRRFATAGIRLLAVPGMHGQFHQEPQFSVFCDILRGCLTGAAPPSARAAEVFGQRYRLLQESDGEVIRGVDGSAFRVAAGDGWGRVDSSGVKSEKLSLSGWAVDVERREPAAVVLVFLDGRYAGRSGLGGEREDLARALSAPGVRYAGFSLSVPWPFRASDRMPRLRAFGLSPSGVAAELQCDLVSGER